MLAIVALAHSSSFVWRRITKKLNIVLFVWSLFFFCISKKKREGAGGANENLQNNCIH